MVELLRLAMLGEIWLDLQCWVRLSWIYECKCVGFDTLNLLCAFTKNHTILYNKCV